MVNKPSTVVIAGDVGIEALRILRDVPGIQVDATTVGAGAGVKNQPDVVISAGGVVRHVEVKTFRHLNAVAASAMMHEIDGTARPAHDWLLVARSTTVEARRLLRDAGVGLVDSSGVMMVSAPGLYLHQGQQVEKPRRRRSAAGSPRLAGKVGVAAQFLMVEPERRWNVTDLAGRAGASKALVHSLFVRLEAENLVEVHGSGPLRTRRLSDPSGLFDRWADESVDRGVRELRVFRLARSPRVQSETVSGLLTSEAIEHAITGAAAAALLAPFVTAVPITDIWLSEAVGLAHAAAVIGAEEASEGHNLVLRQARDDGPLVLRRQRGELWLANPFRVVLDLRSDPRRGREQADRLREEVIGW